MSKQITLNTINKELKKMDITPDSKEYVAGLTLLAALQTGANADLVAKFIHQPRKIVREIAKRLRKNKVWQGSKTCCEWFDKNDGGISFILDCNVAMGLMERVND